MSDLTDAPFHAGERAAQARGGVAPRAAAIRDWMPDQHRAFFAALPFVLAASPTQTAFRSPPSWPVRRASLPTPIPALCESPPCPTATTRRRRGSGPARRSGCSASTSRRGGATAPTA
jgi:predicted pyridoxine 5'-phosphate oxidase superfamily flavin-nucleotide-binding protein